MGTSQKNEARWSDRLELYTPKSTLRPRDQGGAGQTGHGENPSPNRRKDDSVLACRLGLVVCRGKNRKEKVVTTSFHHGPVCGNTQEG